MKEQLEIINTGWEKINPKNNKHNFWSFLVAVTVLIFILLYLILFTIPGWFMIVLTTLIYKFLY
jgi:hypothetical protein